MKVAPSILACDFSRMGEELQILTRIGANLIHLDIMDGHFVPNISFGPAVVKRLRNFSTLPFDVHLMIETPQKYIPQFISAGADIITFHAEAEKNMSQAIVQVKSQKIKVGLALKPETPVEVCLPYLRALDLVLIMTVEPGFGGQKFLPDMLTKIKELKKHIKAAELDIPIEVDGGINEETAAKVAYAGADICVAGTSIFRALDPATAIKTLKESDGR